MKVYVAGQYTKGDVAVNVGRAMDVTNELIAAGYEPYLPHLWHFQHIVYPRPFEDWMRIDLAFLVMCRALVLVPGESAGATREVAEAVRLGLPVLDLQEGEPPESWLPELAKRIKGQ